jgi:acetoin utilization deacetylase AcuC-like enzyme
MLKAEARLRTLILYQDDDLDHISRTVSDWESPARLKDIMNKIADPNEFADHELIIFTHFDKASVELLKRAHSTEYIAFVDILSRQAQSSENVIVFPISSHGNILNEQVDHSKFSVGILQAARRAVGAVAHAVDHVLLGRNRNAFCVVRPPGHHSGHEGLLSNARSCGFCIFNNVAVGALHALEDHKCERVAIIDLDVHHGK